MSLRIRVIDHIGNRQDYDLDHIPRIGERLVRDYAEAGGRPITTHYHRVKDVAYLPDNPAGIQASILVEPDPDTLPWPDRR